MFSAKYIMFINIRFHQTKHYKVFVVKKKNVKTYIKGLSKCLLLNCVESCDKAPRVAGKNENNLQPCTHVINIMRE